MSLALYMLDLQNSDVIPQKVRRDYSSNFYLSDVHEFFQNRKYLTLMPQGISMELVENLIVQYREPGEFQLGIRSNAPVYYIPLISIIPSKGEASVTLHFLTYLNAQYYPGGTKNNIVTIENSERIEDFLRTCLSNLNESRIYNYGLIQALSGVNLENLYSQHKLVVDFSNGEYRLIQILRTKVAKPATAYYYTKPQTYDEAQYSQQEVMSDSNIRNFAFNIRLYALKNKLLI